MKEVILAKCGELVLKGLNRLSFEKQLIKNIQLALIKRGEFKIYTAQSTIYIEPCDDSVDIDSAICDVRRVFGISAVCRAAVCSKDFDEIAKTALEYTNSVLKGAKTFKVDAKRADKTFKLTSPEICKMLGEKLLNAHPGLKVSLDSPEVTVTAEVRDYAAYIHCIRLPGAGGMPYGTGGKACLMLSGGIDSPVAGYMMAKRGVKLTPVHFVSPPYTGEPAKLKVIELTRILSSYCPGIKLTIVPFTEVQQEILKNCKNELFTVIMRRFMLMITNKIAERTGCGAIVTGESLGQVASQTMEALAVTEAVSERIILRPLIGMDKEEIVKISRKIGAFETSILPYEDCCTVFTPRHPKTKPSLNEIEKEEKKLGTQKLITDAAENIQVINIGEIV